MTLSKPSGTRRRVLLAAASVAAMPANSFGQPSWPTRPVRMIVPYGAGNQADLVARALAELLGKRWGQPVIIENVAGAGGAIGVAQIARAAPDGYTIGLAAIAALAVTPHMTRAPYDPLVDLTPLAGVSVASGGVMVVHPSLQVRTVDQLVVLARSRAADPLLYYTAGNGTIPHLSMEVFKRAMKFPATQVPYRTAAAGSTDLIGGQVHMAIDSFSVQRPFIESGKLRVLFTTASTRLPQLPDTPTLREVVPDLELPTAWQSLLGPRGLPPELAARIGADAQAIVADAEFARKLAAGTEPLPMTAAEVSRRLRIDYASFGALVRELGLKEN